MVTAARATIADMITALICHGTLTRFPDIKYIFCHSGGALIPQVGRVVRHAHESKTISAKLPNGPWAEIKKLYFDTRLSVTSASTALPWATPRAVPPISWM